MSSTASRCRILSKWSTPGSQNAWGEMACETAGKGMRGGDKGMSEG